MSQVLDKRAGLLMRLIELHGGRPLRVGRRNDGARRKGSTHWSFYPSEIGIEDVHLRTILPCQTVFDVGDCNDHDCAQTQHERCWGERAVPDAEAIRAALDRMGIAHIMSLSGGKGVHIEVFSDKAPTVHSIQVGESIVEDGGRPDWRRRFAADVLTAASLARGSTVVADPRLKSPNDSSHLVRDWGQRKLDWSPRTKRVWPRGKPLPQTREEAYEMVPHGPDAIPDSIPTNEGLGDQYSLLARGCPRSTACFDPASNDGWPGCGSCPRWN